MREEIIRFKRDMPLDFSLLKIENYPLHWHNATEIVYVLKGNIDITIGLGNYSIKQGELEIVNPNEVHSMKSDDSDNLVLILSIDPNFFEQYYKGAKDVFFYADSSEKQIQKSPRYDKLRRYLAVLYYEYISKHENYKDQIENRLLSMMYYLLNNFHYLFYEEESLREDNLELERYHRIVNYITNNYMEKVSLQEIADKEFLSSQYLSYKIKNTFGHGFNDFLNLTRVEESLKLLLNTEMNITEISAQVGFSHVRYYNRNFKAHYKMTPNQYRQKYKVSDDELEELTKTEKVTLKKALPYLTPYVETYERYQYDDRIHLFDVELLAEPIANLNYCKIINLGSSKEIYSYRNDKNLLEKIKRLKFDYGLVESLSGAFKNGAESSDSFINWHFTDNFIDYIYRLNLKPIIIIDGYEHILDQLKAYIEKHRKDLNLSDIQFVTSEDFYSTYTNLYHGDDKRNDTLYRVGDIISSNLNSDNQIAQLMDSYQPMVKESDTFYGGKGLLAFNGLEKPSYYSYMFLSLLGDEIILKDDGIVVTRSADGFEVLLYDPLKGKEKQSHLGRRKRYSVNILNMEENYHIIRYELNKDSGSVYDKWSYLGSPKVTSNYFTKLLEESTVPEIKFYYGEKSKVHNIFTVVKDRGATLYLFKKE